MPIEARPKKPRNQINVIKFYMLERLNNGATGVLARPPVGELQRTSTDLTTYSRASRPDFCCTRPPLITRRTCNPRKNRIYIPPPWHGDRRPSPTPSHRTRTPASAT